MKKVGEKWCVMHCHGPEAGTPIKCFDTEAEAQAMHRAIEANKKAGFARFPNMDACCTEMKGLGHITGDAMKICSGILERALKGALLKAQPIALEVLSKAGDPEIVLGGYASWAEWDDDGEFFTVEAQAKALQRFFNQPPEFQLVTVSHGRGPVGEYKPAQPILKYTNKAGEDYFSHVNEVGSYFVIKMRDDNSKVTQYYRAKALAGELDGFSVNAIALVRDPEDNRRVLDMEYTAITITEKGVSRPRNPRTRDLKVISKAVTDTPIENEANTPPQPAQKADLSTEDILQKYGFNKTVKDENRFLPP